jgi:CHRD domain-containing protein
MNKTHTFRTTIATAFAIGLLIFGGCSTTASESGGGGGVKVKLTGDEEVPPVKTAASGTGSFVISADKSVSGSITTTGVDGTAAHIHEGPAGKNGPVIVPLTKGANNTWSVAPGAKLTDAQYEGYKSGNLYVNVHSAANKGGEIRAQFKP